MELIRTVGADELRRVGAPALSLREVADRVGISPAGMYRYVDGRDGLLELLIADAFDELAEVVRSAVAAAGPRPRDQMHAFAQAYRAWAKAEPARFSLILGTPVTGFHASETGPTRPAARRFGAAMLGVFVDAERQGGLRRAGRHDPVVELHDRLGLPSGLRRSVLARILRGWAALHGLVVLELDEQLAWSGIDVGELLHREIEDLADDLGIAPR